MHDRPALNLRRVSLRRANRLLVEALDLQLAGGECWAILGPNGAGKSTLLHALAGLFPPHSGHIAIGGQTLAEQPRRKLAQQLGLLLQSQQDPFPSTVQESVLIGRHPHLKRWQDESESDLAIARLALEQVDLAGFESRLVETLSGGERQRLALATLLTQQPPTMLLDEPINHLDLQHQHSLLRLFAHQACTGQLVVMALHDLNLAARYCDRVLLLDGAGSWEAGGADALLHSERLSRLYGVEMVELEGPAGRIFVPIEPVND